MHLKKQYLEYSVGCFLCASDSKVSGKSLMSQVTRLLVEDNSIFSQYMSLCICLDDIVLLPFLFLKIFKPQKI